MQSQSISGFSSSIRESVKHTSESTIIRMSKFLSIVVMIAVAGVHHVVNGKPRGIFPGSRYGGPDGSNVYEQGPCGHDGSHGSEWGRPQLIPGQRGPPNYSGYRQDGYPLASEQGWPAGSQSGSGGFQPDNPEQDDQGALSAGYSRFEGSE